MELGLVLKLVVQNFWIFAFTSIFSLGFVIHQNNAAVPLFRSSIDLFVSTPITAVDVSSLATGSNFGTQRVKSYAQIANSTYTMGEVVKSLKLSLTPSELASKVSAVAPLDTVIITVSVVDSNPTLARDIAASIGEIFSQQVDKLELSSTSSGSPISVAVVKEASLPSSPFYPKKAINLAVGFAVSFVFSFAIGFLRFIRDDRIKNESDLLGVKLLGVFDLEKKDNKSLILNEENTFSKRAEIFRLVRSSLLAEMSLKPEINTNVISICSALSGEGKSTTALDLAVTLAQSGISTLLIEGDLRKPSLKTHISEGLIDDDSLKKNSGSGIVDYLENGVINLENSKIKLLSYMLCERIPQNPAELISDAKIKNLVKALEGRFQVVIFDTPPILPVSDAANIVSNSHFNLLVVQAGKTRLAEYRQTLNVLSNYKTQPQGVILNKVPRQRFLSDYGYGYGYGYGIKKSLSPKYYSYRSSNSYYVQKKPAEKTINLLTKFRDSKKKSEIVDKELNLSSARNDEFSDAISSFFENFEKSTAKKSTAKKSTAKKSTAKKIKI